MKKNILVILSGLFVVVSAIFIIRKLEPFNENIVNKNLQYQVGDIILSDGSTVKIGDYTKVEKDNLPIAMIGGVNGDGNIFTIGLHISDTPLSWTTDSSKGYNTNFKELVAKPTNDENAMEATFSGKLKGKGSLDSILLNEPEDTKDLKNNYPAFYFVDTYAEEHGLTGDYSTGWYIPSIAELCIVYKNRESINNSLHKIYKLDDNLAVNGIGTNWYWSSSQSAQKDDYAWFVHFVNGYAGECPKNFTNLHVLVLHEFLGDK